MLLYELQYATHSHSHKLHVTAKWWSYTSPPNLYKLNYRQYWIIPVQPQSSTPFYTRVPGNTNFPLLLTFLCFYCYHLAFSVNKCLWASTMTLSFFPLWVNQKRFKGLLLVSIVGCQSIPLYIRAPSSYWTSFFDKQSILLVYSLIDRTLWTFFEYKLWSRNQSMVMLVYGWQYILESQNGCYWQIKNRDITHTKCTHNPLYTWTSSHSRHTEPFLNNPIIHNTYFLQSLSPLFPCHPYK